MENLQGRVQVFAALTWPAWASWSADSIVLTSMWQILLRSSRLHSECQVLLLSRQYALTPEAGGTPNSLPVPSRRGVPDMC
jgi:hypothetical protein